MELEDWEEEPGWEASWGDPPPIIVKEPDMTRIIRIAESRKAAQKLWDQVQRELRNG